MAWVYNRITHVIEDIQQQVPADIGICGSQSCGDSSRHDLQVCCNEMFAWASHATPIYNNALGHYLDHPCPDWHDESHSGF